MYEGAPRSSEIDEGTHRRNRRTQTSCNFENTSGVRVDGREQCATGPVVRRLAAMALNRCPCRVIPWSSRPPGDRNIRPETAPK